MGRSTTSRFIRTLDPIHAMIYFAPEAEREYERLGLESATGMGYFASRASAMGAVGAGVVTASFSNFSPRLVAANLPRAWTLASPEQVQTARLRAVDAALTRLLGEEGVGSDEVAQTAELAARASEGCRRQGRPLYAAHADLDWPQPDHVRLWHAVSLLREYRGDAHVQALVSAQLSGLEALVLHCATGKALTPSFARRSRGWSSEAWDDASEQLAQRGLLDPDGSLTEDGTELRERVEAETDRLSTGPAEQLDASSLERLVELGRGLRGRITHNGAFPVSVFATT